MEKTKLLTKLNTRNYNNELEILLDKKNFSENVKNLLLSMLYKIEAGYKDYITVKQNVQSKREYIEDIFRILQEKCKDIEVVKEESEIGEEIKESGKKYRIDKLQGKIEIIHPNEKLLLHALYELDDVQVYLEEKYNLICVAISELLNRGENCNNTEVLRDFNGWSWNTQVDEIVDLDTNLVYQNLIELLGISFIKQWVHSTKVIDYWQLVTKTLEQNYGTQNANQIIELIQKIAILICIQNNGNEKKRLLDEKRAYEKEKEKLEDKEQFLRTISQEKKEALRKIKEIDTILYDKKRLEQEYIRLNEKRKQYNKILNLNHLTEILTRQRKKIVASIEEANRLLEPSYYLAKKGEVEKQLNLLQDIEEPDQENKKKEYILALQKICLDCFILKIENVTQKEEYRQYLQQFRYAQQLNITKQQTIQQMPSIQQKRKEALQVLLQKGVAIKALNIVTNNEQVFRELIASILSSRIINIENINVELTNHKEQLEVDIYEGDILEKGLTFPEIPKQQILVKQAKRVKLFL